MARYKLTIEYDGSRFKGWQLQEDVRSIQGMLINACKTGLKTEQVELYGAGRTDAGVHALGQVAHLEVQTKTPWRLFRQAINDELPHDINVLQVEQAAARFHARHDAVARSYVYQISRRRNAFGKHFTWWIKDQLDAAKMQQAAQLLVGFHDFRAYSNEKGAEKSSMVELQHLAVHERGELILIHIQASHFLWKMVRRLVGCLVEVGTGRMDPATPAGWLTAPSAEPARFTAPPAGLFLEKVYYPGEPITKSFQTLF